MPISEIEQRAIAFAIAAHGSQKRKYTGDAYVTHTQAVADLVRSVGADEATLAAAHLHDVIEDCPVTFFDIQSEFGVEIGELVSFLTDCKPSLGNRNVRKELDRSRLARAPAAVQTIKVADLIDNTSSIVERDPKFAVTYMREKALLLPLLTKADQGLRTRAAGMLAVYEERQVANWLEARPHGALGEGR